MSEGPSMAEHANFTVKDKSSEKKFGNGGVIEGPQEKVIGANDPETRDAVTSIAPDTDEGVKSVEIPSVVTLETLKNPEIAKALIEKTRAEVFEKYERDATEMEAALGKKHITRVAELSREYGEFLGLPEEQIVALEIAAYLHDVQKYNPERGKEDPANAWKYTLMMHAYDSKVYAVKYASENGFDDELTGIIAESIDKHQPMPFIQNMLKAELEACKRDGENAPFYPIMLELQKAYDNVVENGAFNEADSEIPAYLFTADLMSPAILADKAEMQNLSIEKPVAGAIDKYVQINLGWMFAKGKFEAYANNPEMNPLEDAFISGYDSVKANMRKLDRTEEIQQLEQINSGVLQEKIKALKVQTRIIENFAGNVTETMDNMKTNIIAASELGLLPSFPNDHSEKDEYLDKAMSAYYTCARATTAGVKIQTKEDYYRFDAQYQKNKQQVESNVS